MTTHELAEMLLAREDMPVFFLSQLHADIGNGENFMTEPDLHVDNDDEMGPCALIMGGFDWNVPEGVDCLENGGGLN